MSNVLEEEPATRVTGSIHSWDVNKGFGYAEATVGGRHIFMHINDIVGQRKGFDIGEKVSYIQATDNQGRACAEFILRDGESLKKTNSNRGGVLKYSLVLSVLVGLGVIAWLNTQEGSVTFQVWEIEVKRWLSQF